MKILDRLPLLTRTENITFGQRHVRFHRDEILVWLSIGLPGERDPQRISPPFPAMLDTGNGSAFYLHEHHLLQWAGVRPDSLTLLGTRQVNQRDVPSRDADVWVHPNTPGTWQRAPGKRPFRLDNKEGIAVGPPVPDQVMFPRVPLLGVAALRSNGLDFWFDSKAAQCHVWTAGWRSRIMRLLCRI
jgi:hypothetical protein